MVGLVDAFSRGMDWEIEKAMTVMMDCKMRMSNDV